MKKILTAFALVLVAVVLFAFPVLGAAAAIFYLGRQLWERSES
jgi:hypothetical protein